MAVEVSFVERRFAALVSSFPSVANVPGTAPWNADVFDRWAAATPISPGELATARFLLAVWNPGHKWESGCFGLMEAVRIWDDTHHRAFLAWAEAPWWP